MLIDRHAFEFCASVPFPMLGKEVNSWQQSVGVLEEWLTHNVGPRLDRWAWHDSGSSYRIGVAFRWDPDRLLFVISWG